MKKMMITFLGLCALTISMPFYAYAQNNGDGVGNPAFSKTGLPIPRFVSLSNDESSVRTGPSLDYPVMWVLTRKDLPVEVILEFDNWRKIRDPDGQEGWVFHTLLSGKRTALTIGKKSIFAYEKPFNENALKARVVLELEPSVIVEIDACDGAWCLVKASGFSGWIKRNLLWGVYETEIID